MSEGFSFSLPNEEKKSLRVALEEQYARRKLFISLGDFSDTDFTGFIRKHKIEPDPVQGYPIFKIIACMNIERKKRGKSYDSQDGNALTPVEQQLKYEQVQEKRIKNREKLGTLIPISTATHRVRTTFMAVANSIRYAIKQAAPRVAITMNARDCENILIESHNNAIAKLSEAAKNIPWEQEGRDTVLEKTELDDFENQQDGTELVSFTQEDTSD